MRTSVSKVGMFYRCELQYDFRYNQGLKVAPGVAATVGKGTHRATSSDLLRKLETGELLSLEEVSDLAAEGTKREWAEQPPLLDEEEIAMGAAKVQGAAIDKAVKLSRLYHTDLAPTLEPLAVEAESVLRMPNGDELVMVKDVETTTHVRDTKTSARAPKKDTATTSMQLTAYLLESAARGTPKKGVLDSLVATKVPKLVHLETERGQADYAAFIRRFELASARMQSGLYSPCPQDHWACSPKWCGYWNQCPFGAAGRTKHETATDDEKEAA